MQPKPDTHPDEWALEAFDRVMEASDGILMHCQKTIEKPPMAIFGMLMAVARLSAAADIDPRMLHGALDAMLEGAIADQSHGHETH